MSFTLGLDLGIVMAKGVVLGVIACVTILPSLILVFDKAIEKTTHRVILPEFRGVGKFIAKHSIMANRYHGAPLCEKKLISEKSRNPHSAYTA